MVLVYLPAGSWIAVGAVPQAIPAPSMKRVFKKLREILSISVNHCKSWYIGHTHHKIRQRPFFLADLRVRFLRFIVLTCQGDHPQVSGTIDRTRILNWYIPPNIISGQKMCNYISWHAMFIYFLCMNRNVEVLHGFWVPIILCTMTKGRPRHRKSQGFIFDVEYWVWNTRKDQNWRISILVTGMSLKPVLSQVATSKQVPVSNFHMVLGNAGHHWQLCHLSTYINNAKISLNMF